MIVFSQTLTTWGLKLGVTNASQTQVGFGRTYTYGSQLALNAGVFAEWLEHPWFSVNSEIYFSQKGRKNDIPVTSEQFPDGTGEFFRESISLYYLSFAVLPKARIVFDILELYALAGPRGDFLLSRSAQVQGAEPARSNLLIGLNSYLKQYKGIQLGGDFAVGIQTHSLLPFGVGAEIRYSPDFSPVLDIRYFTITNQSWEFLLVLTF